METIGEKIKRIRKSKGLKQREVCEFAGINQSSFASIENGETKSISIEIGQGIAKALNVSFNDLFSIENKFDTKAENEQTAKIKQLEERLKLLEATIKDKVQIISLYEALADIPKLTNSG